MQNVQTEVSIIRLHGRQSNVGDLTKTLKNDASNHIYAPFIDTMAKEVRNQPRHVQQKILTKLKQTQLMVLPFLGTTTVSAQQPSVFNEMPTNVQILPDEIILLLKEIIIWCGVIGVGFAIVCLMGAAGYRMIGNREKAREWTVDVIKGLGQVLMAPVIVFLIVTIVGFVFKNVHGFNIFF